jgi:hypothetical protein
MQWASQRASLPAMPLREQLPGNKLMPSGQHVRLLLPWQLALREPLLLRRKVPRQARFPQLHPLWKLPWQAWLGTLCRPAWEHPLARRAWGLS